MENGRLKVLSYNIHKGFSVGNREFVLRRIRDAIRLVHADLVFLQEVIGDHEAHRQKIEEWPDQSQFEFLADEAWPHFAYGKNAVYTSGHHGNAILSKYPFSFTENIDVSSSKMERRGLLHGRIQIGSGSLHAICVHLGLLEADRKQQIKTLCARIDSHVPHSDPLIIAGDFNDWRQRASGILSQELGTELGVKEAFFELQGAHARTFPAWLPAFRLDRIYYRGMTPESAQCFTGKPWSELSDHAALNVEMRVPLLI